MLFVILSVFLGIVCIIFIGLFFRTKLASKKQENELVNELNSFSELFTKFSFGMLNQHCSVKKLQVSKNVQTSLDSAKCSFNKITNESLKRLCYVGTDAWFEGIACAHHIGEKLKDGGKIVILVTSTLNALIMAQRHRSFVNTLTKEYPKVKILETFEAHANQDLACNYIREKANEIDGVYVTGNSAVGGVAKGLAQAGKQNDVLVLCHDLDEVIVQNMRKGLVTASVVCSTYAQGYDPVVHLYNNLAAGWTPFQPRLMQKLETVTVKNLSEYWDDANKEPRRSAAIHNSGVAPIKTDSRKNLKILVLCEDWNTAFAQMKSGIERAQHELKMHSCEVVVKVLNQLKKPVQQVLYEAEMAIMSEQQTGLDGIVAFVGFGEFVNLLNKYSAEGIVITTFNSEPLTLRSMVDWLMVSSNQLKNFSQNYQNGFSEVDKLQRNVCSSLESVVQRSSEQTESVNYGAKTVEDLTVSIDKTADDEALQLQTVHETTDIGNSLAEMVNVFDSQVQGLRTMGEQVKKSAAKTDAIRVYSEKIESIITMIDDISEQTNLLAFNAAVESTHAGEWGKGFKVISQEIRTLADKSVESTSSISNLISDMRTAVNEGIEANSSMLGIVNDQVQSVSHAAMQLADLSKNLLESIRQVQDVVERNSLGFSEMHKSAQGINKVMAATTQVSNDNTNTVQNINKEFSQMTDKFSDMTEKTNQLTELITIMEGTVASFSSD